MEGVFVIKISVRLILIFVCGCLAATFSGCRGVRPHDSSGLNRSSTNPGFERGVRPNQTLTGDSYWEAFQESYHRVKEGFPPPSQGNVGEPINSSDPRVKGWQNGAWAAALDELSR